jgi:DNA-binding response OmpR family regulator
MNLRRKMALPAGGPAIKTVYGVGYRFETSG